MSEDANDQDPRSPLLEGVRLVKSDDHFNNYQFVWPNGARVRATMTEVLLWEIHNQNDSIMEYLMDIEGNTR